MFLKNKSTAVDKIAASGKESVSVIGKDMHLLGNVVCDDGMIDFDGSIDGNIRCHTLNVRKNGSVNGEITADSVFVYGKVKGIVRAKNVYLFNGCRIEGIVMHESIAMEDGAFLDGKLKRTDKPLATEEIEDPVEESAPGVKMLENIRLIRA